MPLPSYRTPRLCPLAYGLSIAFAALASPLTHAGQPPASSHEDAHNATRVQVARVAVRGVGEHPGLGISPARIEALAKQALEDFKQPLPAALDFNQIQQISDRITRAYRDAGFMVALVYVPPQQFDDSQTLVLEVLEGRVGRVLIQGSQRYRDDQLGASSLDLIGRPLRKAELERALLYARDLPGVSVSAVLQPGQNPGDTDIVLVATDSARPYEITAGLSNHGTDNTGQYRAELGLSAFNALGAGDVLAASVGYGLDPTDSWQAAFSLTVPSSRVPGLSAMVGASRGEIDLNSGPFAEIGINGPTTLLQAGGEWRFVQSNDLRVLGSARWIHEESRLDGLGMQLSRHSFDVLDAGLGLSHTDRRWRGINQAQVSLRKSFNDESSPQDWLYAAHASYFWLARVSLARLQTLPGDQRLWLRGSAQFTGDALTPLEQFSVGGPGSVRAYPLSASLGDRGVQATLEYQVGAPGFADAPSRFDGRRWGDLLELSLFYDWGRTSPAADNRRLGVAPVTLEGAGAGLSLRLPWQHGLRLETSAARPTGSHPGTEGRSTQYWVRVSSSF